MKKKIYSLLFNIFIFSKMFSQTIQNTEFETYTKLYYKIIDSIYNIGISSYIDSINYNFITLNLQDAKKSKFNYFTSDIRFLHLDVFDFIHKKNDTFKRKDIMTDGKIDSLDNYLKLKNECNYFEKINKKNNKKFLFLTSSIDSINNYMNDSNSNFYQNYVKKIILKKSINNIFYKFSQPYISFSKKYIIIETIPFTYDKHVKYNKFINELVPNNTGSCFIFENINDDWKLIYKLSNGTCESYGSWWDVKEPE